MAWLRIGAFGSLLSNQLGTGNISEAADSFI